MREGPGFELARSGSAPPPARNCSTESKQYSGRRLGQGDDVVDQQLLSANEKAVDGPGMRSKRDESVVDDGRNAGCYFHLRREAADFIELVDRVPVDGKIIVTTELHELEGDTAHVKPDVAEIELDADVVQPERRGREPPGGWAENLGAKETREPAQNVKPEMAVKYP